MPIVVTEDGTIKRPYENRVGSIGYGDMREDGMYMSYRENAVHQYIGLRTFSGYGILCGIGTQLFHKLQQVQYGTVQVQ